MKAFPGKYTEKTMMPGTGRQFFLIIVISMVFLLVSCNEGNIKITRRHKNGMKKIGVKIAKDGTTHMMHWNSQGYLEVIHIFRDKAPVRKVFFRLGHKRGETFYVKNQKVKALWYHPDGSVSDSREYKNGKPHGRWAYWDKKGRLVSDVIYEYGKIQKKTGKK